jgi:chaperonin GroEL
MAVNPKTILFGREAREKMMHGAYIMFRAVGTTLGPKGRNVSMDTQYAGQITVHDGISVSNEIYLEDPAENIGAKKIREAAAKTNDKSGDGTTTSVVLAYEIAKQGESYLVAGDNPMLLVKGIDKAIKQAVSLLEKMAEPIEGNLDKMIQVATVSAADEEIGKTVAQALEKVGTHGVVTVDKGTVPGYVTEFKDGMEWDKGWIHPMFVWTMRDGKVNEKLEASVENPYILITDQTLTTLEEVLPILTVLKSNDKKDLVIISPDGLGGQAMQVLHQNLTNRVFNVLPVTAPTLGQSMRDGLEDIAVLTGGTLISKEMGMSLKDIKLTDFGQADKVVAFQDSTTIIGGKGEKQAVLARAKQLEEQANDADHEYQKEKFQERLAKLTSGVAVIKVGTASDAENREKVERVRDAIGATKAAVDEGIIPGGGLALFRISQQIDTSLPIREEALGAEIVQKALSKPIKLLAENAGVSGDVVASKVAELPEDVGYDVVTGEYVKMKDNGIVDPVRVTISALQNAASVANMILTTEAVIVDKEQEKKQQEPQ